MDIYKYGKKLRCGYTTGACAAAAAGAAAEMLLNKTEVQEYELVLKGEPVRFVAEDVTRSADAVKCAVRKDAGSDIDITDGMLIYAEVRYFKGYAKGYSKETEEAARGTYSDIIICGGEGIGTVTKPGLDQPPGEAAINSGPRRMITEAVARARDEAGCDRRLVVTVSAPEGRAAAEKTFNPVLGIEGGISILGSTGIVEPMSEPAVIETIKAELRVKWLELQASAEGRTPDGGMVLVPGNYGVDFALKKLDIPASRIVKCSNFIGDALDCACGLGIPELILAGNLGKLIKLAGGIFNTHSRNADCRMDIMMRSAFAAIYRLCGDEGGGSRYTCMKPEPEGVYELMGMLDACVTTDAALSVLDNAHINAKNGISIAGGQLRAESMRVIAEKAAAHIKKRCTGAERGMPEIRLIIISNDQEVLAETVIK